jgi:aminopeptidase N
VLLNVFVNPIESAQIGAFEIDNDPHDFQMKSAITPFLAICLALSACQPRTLTLPTVNVTAIEGGPESPQGTYRASTTRKFDLLHTGLDVSFNWEKEELEGVANLRLKPWFHPADTLTLDAKGFVIHNISRKEGGEWIPLTHRYDLRKLDIALDRAFTKNEEVEIRIGYTARPGALLELLGEEEGQERGLYFINPRGLDKEKPRQIWTQGETHGSSAWFPTIDSPNERCTQEMWITVQDTNFKTLSNGLLIGSRFTDTLGGMVRTDHWKMTQPHAPYLFMMAVGDFSVTKDTWRGKEVSYYVEPKYAPYASLIFGNTPEMLEFFSNKLGVAFPWEKYSQIVVRDFVSGAMENTTATIHFGGLQHDAREHLDETLEDYISHELFHQWFGDLVTCESWANLTLNEGFATYGEYLWKEYKYGQDAAEHHLAGDLRGYLGEAAYKQEPLIRYRHGSPDDMFDAHSYQKGGLVLHMLRYYLGDAAFFEGIKRYLTVNAFTDVEADVLRMALEEVSGEDLNWFFDQWYFDRGHPVLKINHTWEQDSWVLRVQQTQVDEGGRSFRFPLRLDMVQDGQHTPYQVWVETADTSFRLPASKQPDNVVFDADKGLLAAIMEEEKPAAAWIAQLRTGTNYGQKAQAIDQIEMAGPSAAAETAVIATLDDKFWALRARALEYLSSADANVALASAEKVMRLLQDPTSDVRRAALDFYAEQYLSLSGKLPKGLEQEVLVAIDRATGDSSYRVQEGALRVLHLYDPPKGTARIKAMMPNVPARIAPVAADILIREEDPAVMPWIESRLAADRSPMGKSGMIRPLGVALSKDKLKADAKRLLMGIAATDESWWIRYAAFRNLENNLEEDDVKGFFKERLALEKNDMLLSYLRKMLE